VHTDYTTPEENPMSDIREEMAEVIARTFPGWNDDTSEPLIQDPTLRAHAEAHWRDVNETCLTQGRKMADALLKSDLFVKEWGAVPPKYINNPPSVVPGYSKKDAKSMVKHTAAHGTAYLLVSRYKTNWKQDD
jgi:hypothetical protein